MLTRRRRVVVLGHEATAASTATHGWHTATTCAPGPIARRNVIMCSMYSSSAEGAGLDRDVAGVVPVGDVDVVVGQHRAGGVAKQRGEMARHRRDEQHRGWASLHVFPEVQQRAERRASDDLLVHRDLALADLARRRCRTAADDA